jgi:hypothetical protein
VEQVAAHSDGGDMAAGEASCSSLVSSSGERRRGDGRGSWLGQIG